MDLQARFRGCLLGLALGDAVGTTVEFKPRGSFPPVTDLTGGGPFQLPAGAWTDDTAMALCLAASLVERGGFDARDQMDRYVRWYRQGYWSSTGVCFDIGNTTRQALHHYEQTGDPFSGSTDPHAAGNGSLMRLAPVVLYFYPDLTQARHFAAESSRTTHAALECLEACQLFAELLVRALRGDDKAAILRGCDPAAFTAPALRALAQGAYLNQPAAVIRGTGYVVASLEAALWCFAATDDYQQAVLAAANLGDDADTTAAICGQLAGAYYGEAGLPAEWRRRLVQADTIRALADQLAQHP